MHVAQNVFCGPSGIWGGADGSVDHKVVGTRPYDLGGLTILRWSSVVRKGRMPGVRQRNPAITSVAGVWAFMTRFVHPGCF